MLPRPPRSTRPDTLVPYPPLFRSLAASRKIGPFSQARRTHIERTIVEVVAEGGTTGLGETRPAGAADIIDQHFLCGAAEPGMSGLPRARSAPTAWQNC